MANEFIRPWFVAADEPSPRRVSDLDKRQTLAAVEEWARANNHAHFDVFGESICQLMRATTGPLS